MSFIWPNMLWLLFIIPVLVVLYLLVMRRRKRNAVRYASIAMVKEAMGKGPSFRRHVPPLLFLFALAVMIVAMARPAANVTLPSERGTVILAIDVSGSMRATDIKPNRIEAAQEAARAFVNGQPRKVRIGVVAFSGFANIVQAPTLNRDDIVAAIDRLVPQRATAIGTGILVSLSAIFPDLQFDLGPQRRDFGGGGFGGFGGYGGLGQGGGFGGQPGDRFGSNPRDPNAGTPLGQTTPKQPLPEPVPPGSYKSAAIILLTDGQSNTGVDPMEAAQRAADLGVRVYTVGLGTTNGQVIGFGGWRAHVQLDENTLKKIASLTVGKYFRAGNDSELNQIYRGLSTRLITEKQKSELSAIVTAVGAAIVLVAAFLSLIWFGRLT